MENYTNLMYMGIMLIPCGITVICGSMGFFEKYMPERNFGDFLSSFQAGIFISFISAGVYYNARFLIAVVLFISIIATARKACFNNCIEKSEKIYFYDCK